MASPLVHLVDDDAEVRGTLARLLASGGYDVVEHESGSALLDSVKALGGACILLDINMGEPDGFAVNQALADRLIDIPVVLMTACDDVAELTLRAGVADVLQKPFGRGELLSVLDQLGPSTGLRPASAAVTRPASV